MVKTEIWTWVFADFKIHILGVWEISPQFSKKDQWVLVAWYIGIFEDLEKHEPQLAIWN